jgi:hypothetical protein
MEHAYLNYTRFRTKLHDTKLLLSDIQRHISVGSIIDKYGRLFFDGRKWGKCLDLRFNISIVCAPPSMVVNEY